MYVYHTYNQWFNKSTYLITVRWIGKSKIARARAQKKLSKTKKMEKEKLERYTRLFFSCRKKHPVDHSVLVV